MNQLKLLAITIGIWFSSILVIMVTIVFVASLTADLYAARMGIPLFCLGTVAVLTVAADIFMLTHFAKKVEDEGLRRLWIGAFIVLEIGTVALLMAVALVVLNR
jgi:lysylphosphatidylglycerol synthetase-like protein (DUF2156 family)